MIVQGAGNTQSINKLMHRADEFLAGFQGSSLSAAELRYFSLSVGQILDARQQH